MGKSPLKSPQTTPLTSVGSADPSVAESFATSMGSTVTEHGSSSPGPASIDETITPSPGQLGRYRLDELLGKGGFGEVWRAFDPVLQRKVAIKLPRSDREYPSEHAEILLREARRVANLKIPGIAPVFDVGVENGRVFVVYQLLDGGTLAGRMSERKFTSAEAAELIATIAEALHQAHLNDLVHRDIKPANILLDAKGWPFVADFGLATSEREQLREQNITVGTFAYMSPEQASGESHRVDARTDVYSLGVILFELLTGRLPYVAESASEYLDQVVHREPRPPRTIDDSIPRELERICLKALAKKVGERYTTAADLAHDLRQWNGPRPWRTTRAGRLFLVVGAALLIGVLSWGLYAAIFGKNGAAEGDTSNEPSAPASEEPTRKAVSPAPSDAVPAAGLLAEFDEFPPSDNMWTPGLQRPPKLLIWPAKRENSSVRHDQADKSLHVACEQLGLIELGHTDQPQLAIQARISQPSWEGGIGFFFGYHADEERGPGRVRLQTATLERKTEKGKHYLIMHRNYYAMDDVGTIREQLHVPISDPIELPNHPLTLELLVNKSDVTFRWGGAEGEHVREDELRFVKPADYQGRFGLLISQAAGVFRNVNVKFPNPDKSNPDKSNPDKSNLDKSNPDKSNP